MTTKTNAKGKLLQVIGAVVDVSFEDGELPAILVLESQEQGRQDRQGRPPGVRSRPASG